MNGKNDFNETVVGKVRNLERRIDDAFANISKSLSVMAVAPTVYTGTDFVYNSAAGTLYAWDGSAWHLVASPGAGVTDHGLLTGLADDDHLQYLNTTRGDLRYQLLDATLTSIALLGTAADKMAYTTGVDTWAETSLTAAGRALLDDIDAAAQRITLGLGGAAVISLPVSIPNGGTGQITAQAAIDALTTVAGATNEYVLTKDTATGNALYKAIPAPASGSITLAQMANLAAYSIVGNNTASPATPLALTIAQVLALGGLATSITAGKTLTLAAANDYTLTVPESMIVAGRNVTNTFSAIQTFAGTLIIADGDTIVFSSHTGVNSDGTNLWIGGGGVSSIGAAGETYKGSLNLSVGKYALASATTGFYLTSLGASSLAYVTSGYRLVAIGALAGTFYGAGFDHNTTSNDSIYIGADTRAGADGDTNEIVIGYGLVGNGSNSVTLGNTSIVKTILNGNVGIGTVSPGKLLSVGANFWQVDINGIQWNNGAQTTVNGLTGTAIWSMSFQGGSYKKFIVYLTNFTSAGTVITFPTAFTKTPYVYGDAAAIAVTTTTTCTLTSVGAVAGFVIVEGY